MISFCHFLKFLLNSLNYLYIIILLYKCDSNNEVTEFRFDQLIVNTLKARIV